MNYTSLRLLVEMDDDDTTEQKPCKAIRLYMNSHVWNDNITADFHFEVFHSKFKRKFRGCIPEENGNMDSFISFFSKIL